MKRPEQEIHKAVVSHLNARSEQRVVWEPIRGWEGIYVVSSMGKVMRVAAGKGTYVGKMLQPLIGKDGYHRVQLSENNIAKTVKIHRLVLETFSAEYAPGIHADHINGDKSDNSFWNLRCVTNGQNAINKGLYRTNKLGVKGVRFRRNKYEAQIQISGKKLWLGAFDTIEEADAAYKAAAAKHHGEFARSA